MRNIRLRLAKSLIPLLASLILTNVGHADAAKTYGDWITSPAEDGSFLTAFTVNLAGDYLGEFCYLDKHCEWRLTTKDFSCNPGATSTVLLNAKTGTSAVNTTCVGELVKGSWTSKIKQWSTFEGVVSNNLEVAFAMPGLETSFRVVRFSLRGMNAATASIGGAINPKAPNAQPARAAADETL